MAGPVVGPPSQLHHKVGSWQGPKRAEMRPVQGPGHNIRAGADGFLGSNL